jgi:hypothetical protein
MGIEKVHPNEMVRLCCNARHQQQQNIQQFPELTQ